MSGGVNLAQLRALVAVAESGGFGAAAGELGISQSAVSHAVAALERAVGAPVVHRTGRVRPTPLGEQLLPHARAATASADAIAVIAARHRGGPAGTVRLAAPATVCQGLLPGLLGEWRATHPRVKVRIFEGEDDELAAWLATGTVDAAVLIDPDPAPAGSLQLAQDSMHALLRRDHPLAGQPVVDIRDLEDDAFLLSEGGCERHIREIYRRIGARFTPTHRIRDVGTLISMVHAGIGVSVMPALANAMIPAGCVLVPLLPRVTRRLVLTGPADRPWHPAVTALVATAGGVPGG
ncbi:LysR family transcriptional regulator [Kitasatospora sp. NPDC001175]|uniref:LysR family transcriptional regulator n=1 Tax=Kitasatospora sp. NPDC001175 TaxID=3157103 RepID=UPI003D010660